jgi:phospholipid transport system substrate-binding protein
MIDLRKTVTLLMCAISMAAVHVPGALADTLPPDAQVKVVADEVLSMIASDKDIQHGDMSKVVALATDKILPHFDFDRMSRMTLGKSWKDASPQQREAFTAEFRELITRTYSSALAKYRNQSIEYKPFHSTPEDTDVIVKSTISQSGGSPIGVNYSLEKSGDEWKVFDVVIDNISLVTTYRGQFASEINNNGIDGLIQKRRTKNKG